MSEKSLLVANMAKITEILAVRVWAGTVTKNEVPTLFQELMEGDTTVAALDMLLQAEKKVNRPRNRIEMNEEKIDPMELAKEYGEIGRKMLEKDPDYFVNTGPVASIEAETAQRTHNLENASAEIFKGPIQISPEYQRVGSDAAIARRKDFTPPPFFSGNAPEEKVPIVCGHCYPDHCPIDWPQDPGRCLGCPGPLSGEEKTKEIFELLRSPEGRATLLRKFAPTKVPDEMIDAIRAEIPSR